MSASLLFVHSDTDDRAMYTEYLRAHGYSVLEVPTTDAALPLLPHVDLVITELMVSGTIDGVELITRVRNRPTSSRKPIIVVTGWVVTELRELAERAGCDVLLTKPCLPDALLNEVRLLLEKPKATLPDRRKEP